jgi:multisubunit Na+/H+ antiporter MnhC subunit
MVVLVIATLTGTGIYLILRPKIFSVILGFMLLGHATNLLILTMGRLKLDQPPILSEGVPPYTDPLAQAFILTAIVIGFAVSVFLLVLGYRTAEEAGSDNANGPLPKERGN